MAHPSHLRLVGAGPEPDVGGGAQPALTIDCAVCAVRQTDACDDCVVSYLVGHEAGTPVELDAEEKRAVDLLAAAGLVPASRFSSRPTVA